MQELLLYYRYRFLQKQVHAPNKQLVWKWGMSLALNDQQFGHFIQYLKNECQTTLPPKPLLAATKIGLQLKSRNLWVLGENMELEDGNLTADDDHKYIWLADIIRDNLPTNIRIKELLPTIQTPLETSILTK